MNTPEIRFYHSASTWMEGRAIEQLRLTASLPGMVAVAGMPDLHPGLSTPVGAAMRTRGVIYPELVGGDAGCGMALFRTTVPAGRLKAARLERRLLAQEIPIPEFDFPAEFPQWLRRDLGTLGHGNHFAELQELAEIRLPERAEALGIDRRVLWLLVHSGSRGHGQALLERTPKGGIDPGSEAGGRYLERHGRLLEWARLNRRVAAAGVLALANAQGECVSDNCHNSVTPDPAEPGCWIHRKGAASTESGAPFVIAGSRGTLSFFVEPAGAQAECLWSAAHGAGRKWNRSGARARLEGRYRAEDLRRTKLGGIVVCPDRALLYEEAPEAYKNIETVVADLENAGLVRVIASFRPLLTCKSPRERD